MTGFEDFRNAVLNWLTGRDKHQKSIVQTYLQQIVIGNKSLSCHIFINLEDDFYNYFLKDGDDQIWRAIQAKAFVNAILESQCDKIKYERTLERRLHFLKSQNGLNPDQVAAAAVSTERMPAKFAGWTVAKAEWDQGVDLVFTSNVFFDWHSTEWHKRQSRLAR